jgi:hypothetical protein
MTATVSKTKNAPGKESCGNAGAVESVESQKQASPSSHSPLGISPRTGEIPTFPQLRRKQADGKMENQKQVSHFPTATNPLSPGRKNPGRGRASPSARRRALRAALRVKE